MQLAGKKVLALGYYIRVLAEKDDHVPVSQLRKRLRTEGLKNAVIEVEEGTEDAWNQIIIRKKGGTEIVVVERNVVAPESLGQEEIEEFLEKIQDERPKSAAIWLANYLPSVKVIYAFQVLNGAYQDDGWDVIGAVHGEIWDTLKGIIQADLEGFSNQDGYHILWQFSDDVKGPRDMAVITESGEWVAFEMDLGNKEHRRAFLEGRMSKKVKRL